MEMKSSRPRPSLANSFASASGRPHRRGGRTRTPTRMKTSEPCGATRKPGRGKRDFPKGGGPEHGWDVAASKCSLSVSWLKSADPCASRAQRDMQLLVEALEVRFINVIHLNQVNSSQEVIGVKFSTHRMTGEKSS